jgi:hypothetical protein
MNNKHQQVTFTFLVIVILGLTFFIYSNYERDKPYTGNYVKNTNKVTNYAHQIELSEFEKYVAYLSKKGTKSHSSKSSFIKYDWEDRNNEFYISYEYPNEDKDFYDWRSRDRKYSDFVNDEYDDKIIKKIASTLEKLNGEAGFENNYKPYLAISFIQSLPYTTDKISAGYDEYPRFPLETLYSGGGDCEDTSILAAAILKEMGYGVALIILPEHMAVGIKCDDSLYGYGYELNGQRYCYLETTGINWKVGSIPEEFENKKVRILPI